MAVWPGASGGPVFDKAGAIIGIVVRGATLPGESMSLARVVRTTWIRQRTDKLLDQLSADQRVDVAPFLPW